MSTVTQVQELIINKLTRAQYNTELQAGRISNTELYLVQDDIDINSLDNITLRVQDGVLRACGVRSVDGQNLDVWSGTSAEYTTALASGSIGGSTVCMISDDATSLLQTINFKVPTKVSELANDSEFVSNTSLNTFKGEVLASVQSIVEDGGVVKLSREQEFTGLNTFNAQLRIKGANNAKLQFVGSVSGNVEGELEVGSDGIYFNNSRAFTESNLQAGSNITFSKVGDTTLINGQIGGSKVNVDGTTITKDEDDTITAEAILGREGNPVYVWRGTKDEYEKGIGDGTIKDFWVCIVDDDDSDVYFDYELLNKVNKKGDTMSGNLTIALKNGARGSVFLKEASKTRAEALSGTEARFSGCVEMGFSDGTTGYCENYVANNRSQTQLVATKDNSVYANFHVGLDENNKIYFSHPQVVTDYVNGESGYRIWSNGYCEQWGKFTSTAGGSQLFTFPVSFKNTNYQMHATNYQVTDAGICVFAFTPYSNSQCYYCTAYNGNYYGEIFYWRAYGYVNI